MAKDKKFLFKITLVIILVLTIIISVTLVNAKTVVPTISYDINSTIVPTTNFFTQEINHDQVATTTDDAIPLTQGYEMVCENTNLKLFVNMTTWGIALYDKQAEYYWYSNYEGTEVNATQSALVNSGVTIECYNSSDSALPEATKYSAVASDFTGELQKITNGFRVAANFITVGISFDYEVILTETSIQVRFIADSLVEVPYQTKAMKNPKEYKLKSVVFFPYLGANNYQINAYAFIPDGSGALIRYNDEASSTAFIKRIYGDDYGILTESNYASHITNQQVVTLPIYGINHGYQQAAIFANITSGAGSAELHAYPYQYGSLGLNRTFFKYYARDSFLVNMSTGARETLKLINDEIYPTDYVAEYTFLNGSQASYIGMAQCYQTKLGLQDNVDAADNIDLKLDVIAQDYKNGLFGKNFIAMTTYDELKGIVGELIENDISDLQITYMGWNKGGYYDNTPIVPRAAPKLGGTKAFTELVEYLDELGIDLYHYDNPMVVTANLFNSYIVKKINLERFSATVLSALPVDGYYQNVSQLATNILKYADRFAEWDLTNLNLVDLGSTSYSFSYDGESVYRSEMIELLKAEVAKLSEYRLGLTSPNDYLYAYLASYYEAPYESSKYAFETDSVPFIPLLLSGSVPMFATYTNFVSDYQLFALRLIEYNIYPSFIITEEATHNLRYTNFEYVYTSEFATWLPTIKTIYNQVNGALKSVVGAKMVNHCTIASGITKIDYDNGVSIYLNYTSAIYSTVDGNINPQHYLVVGGA